MQTEEGQKTHMVEDYQDHASGKTAHQDKVVHKGTAYKIPWFKDRVLIPTILLVFLLDQLSKHLVRAGLDLYDSWPHDGLLRITRGTNSGAAFGLFPNQTTVLIFASFIAIGFLFYFYRIHILPNKLLRFAIGLQLGGAFGNLFDRLSTGEVLDFIDVGWWPIFNLADSSILVGITILAGTILLTGEAEPEPKSAETSAVKEE